MDPDAALEDLRRLAAAVLAHLDSLRATGGTCGRAERDALLDAERLADCVQALDQWASRGGFLPAAWRNGRAR